MYLEACNYELVCWDEERVCCCGRAVCRPFRHGGKTSKTKDPLAGFGTDGKTNRMNLAIVAGCYFIATVSLFRVGLHSNRVKSSS